MQSSKRAARILFIRLRGYRKCDGLKLTPYQLRVAASADLPKVKSFLRGNGLPDLGVDDWIQSFVIAEDRSGNWIGVAGLERYGESGLLRSVAVDSQSRGRGYGGALIDAVLRNARAEGLKKVYLLTDDADEYFERFGFQTVKRQDVDALVKTSREFTEACPESALVMRKVVN